MKLIPPAIRTIQALPWRGAITAETNQRLTLRLYLAALILFLAFLCINALVFFTLVGVSLVFGHMDQVLSMGSGVFVGLSLFALFIWVLWNSIKLDILRLRNLGLSTMQAVTSFVAVQLLAVAPVIYIFANAPSWTNLGAQMPILPYIPFFILISAVPFALYQYLMYFETTPLAGHKTKVLKPLANLPQRAEKVALFLLQTYIWYSILKAPLDVIFPS